MRPVIACFKPGRAVFRAIAVGLAVPLVLVSLGCGKRRRPSPTIARPPTPPVPSKPHGGGPVLQGETGIASWYGHPYHGRRTANGEVYNMHAMTAAHRTMAFNTMVRVHNLENGRDVTVRINDRGPFVEGRIIDLSYAAAQAMGMPSTALVRLEILGKSPPGAASGEPGAFSVQVGAFKDRRNAERLKDSIAHRYRPVVLRPFETDDGTFYRVLVGRESTEHAARELAQKLVQAGFAIQTFIIRLD